MTLTTTSLQGLSTYFRISGLFYYFTTDLEGNFTYVNPLFQHTFHHLAPDFYASPSANAFIGADRDRYRKALRECLENPDNRISADLQLQLPDGLPLRIRWEFSQVITEKAKPGAIQAVGTKLEDSAALIEIEKRLRSQANILNNVTDTIVTTDLERKVTSWNKVAEQLTGISEPEAIGKRAQDMLDTSYAPFTHDQVAEIVFRDGIWHGEMSFTGADGERKYFLHTVSLFCNERGEKLGLLGVGKEITERKKAQQKERSLSQQLVDQEIQKQKLITQATIDGQEKEKQEIGKELHDNINQHLTTTRLYLEVAKERASGPVLEMIQLSHKTLVGIINEIRRLSQSLVPPTLGDIGLVESIQDICDSLQRAHTFKIEFYHRHFYEERMAGNMKLMLFRIIQEQVSNVIRHAQASQFQIRLQSDAENIILTISDNGIGFDPAHCKKGLGFGNIFNRISLFNGKMDIDAAPGMGCRLTVNIPLPAINGVSEEQRVTSDE